MCNHVARIIAGWRRRVKPSGGEQRRELFPFGRIDRWPKAGGLSEHPSTALDIAQGETDGTVVEPEAGVIGAQGACRRDRVRRLGKPPESVQGPRQQILA